MVGVIGTKPLKTSHLEYFSASKCKCIRAVIVGQRSLPIPEIRGSNPVIDKIL